MEKKLKKRRRFDLQKAAFILPNLFTVSSIFCGFYAATIAAGAVAENAQPEFLKASVAILFAMVFDSVDGRVARLTRTQSAFGVQMDSLADAISFGLAPALVAWHWVLSQFGAIGMFCCFIYCAAGTIRLARFNVMAASSAGPSSYFLGLPIPAAAGLLVAMIISSIQLGVSFTREDGWVPWIMVLLGIYMVSNVRFPTFKSTRLSAQTVALTLVVLSVLIALGYFFSAAFSVLILMVSYLLFGTVESAIRALRGGGDIELDEHETSPEPDFLDPLLEDGEEELID